MERIDHYPSNFGSRPAQWTSPYSTIVMNRDVHVKLTERLLLELGLWSMLGLVALVILASRYLAPALVIVAILGAAGLIALGLR